jgi:hypothetical protein
MGRWTWVAIALAIGFVVLCIALIGIAGAHPPHL